MHGLLGVLLFVAGQGAPASVPYRWTSVPRIDGAYRPSVKEIRYAPMAPGEEYRWDMGDFAPETVVRLGPQGGLDFSLDAGENWRPVPTTPSNARGGRIAVSSDGRVWVWSLPEGAYRTEDYGFVWTPCEGVTGLRVVADRTSPSRFYALDFHDDQILLSEDGGRNFRVKPLALPGGPPRPDKSGRQDQLYPTPGRSGDLWLAAADGLYHAPVGRAWARLPGVSEIRAFGFGKGKGQDAALYLIGVINGARGVFRSFNGAKSWVMIGEDAQGWGTVLQIAGDPKRLGRVYMETQERGLLVGDSK